ncbi:MAG: hypothetical protein KF819_27100 [Labilithrix sp.]|nr:hypothetical protein [Labilithrix sp.]
MASPKKNVDLKKPVERPKVPTALLFRMFVIGTVAVVAAGYGIYRYYFVPRAPMLVPAPPATEVPAPELVPQ